MRPDFSEFSYGYSLLREIEDRTIAAYGRAGSGRPILPSLREEKELGFDAAVASVGMALFLQFKVGEYVSRRHPNSATWPEYLQAHYRFAIDTGHHQFDALCRLAALLRQFPAQVAYIAPRFHDASTLTSYHVAGVVLQHSYSCDPLQVDADGDVHYRSVRPDGADHRLFSEPRLTSDGINLPGVIDRSFAPSELTVGSLVELLGAAAAEAEYDVDELLGADREPGFKLWRISELLGLTPMIWTLPAAPAPARTD